MAEEFIDEGRIDEILSMNRSQRQAVIYAWCRSAFGVEHATNLAQRGVRLLEEAIELYQATGATAEMAHRLVDFVFSRPVGNIEQELGGVSVCYFALASAAGLSADRAEAKEVARVLAFPIETFSKRNQEKNKAGFNTTGD